MAAPKPFLVIPTFAVLLNGQKLERELAWQISGVTVEDRLDSPSMFTLDVVSNEFGASWLMLIRLFQHTTISCGRLSAEGDVRSSAPRMSLYGVGLRSVPRPSRV